MMCYYVGELAVNSFGVDKRSVLGVDKMWKGCSIKRIQIAVRKKESSVVLKFIGSSGCYF